MVIKLDLKDKKILHELDMNARQPISIIAKKVGLSRQVVEYRIDRMEKKDLLQGYYTILNTSKLGYLYCRIHLNLRSISPEKELKIVNYIKDIKKVIWLSQQQGEKWEIAIVVLVKNFLELDDIYKHIIYRFSNNIENSDVSAAVLIYHYKNKFLLNKNMEYPSCVIGEEISNYNLDYNQKKILDIITVNARENIIDIAKKTKLDVKTITRNIKKLIDDNIILEFRPAINFNLLGLSHYHVFLTFDNMNFEKQKKIVNFIKNHPYTIYTTFSIGFPGLEFDILLQKNLDLVNFINKFKTTFPETLRNYYSEMSFKLHKNVYYY